MSLALHKLSLKKPIYTGSQKSYYILEGLKDHNYKNSREENGSVSVFH